MAPSDHVLITRFNLPSAGAEGLIRAREGWLSNRVELFERYCLPSVAAQTEADFTWLVYFDPESPEWLKERIAEWHATTVLTPVFRTEVPSDDLVADLAAVTGRSHSHLLTTNLDNDDAIATDFVARLQSVSPADHAQAIYVTNGLIRTNDRLYERRDPTNAFCSVLEPWSDSVRTCWSEWHNLLGQTMPTVEVGGRPGWLQVVHGTNVSNRVRGRLASPAQHSSAFGQSLTGLQAPQSAQLVYDRVFANPVRSARDSVRSAVKSVLIRIGGKSGLDRLKVTIQGFRR